MRREYIVAIVAAAACDRCPSKPPKSDEGICHPCEASAYMEYATSAGDLGSLQAVATPPACANIAPSSEGWNGVSCPLLAAHYLARTVQWDGSDESMHQWCIATHVLPCDGAGPGCNAAPIGGPASIVGEPEIEDDVGQPSVALLVNASALEGPLAPESQELGYFEQALDEALARDEELCERLDPEHPGPVWVWGTTTSCTAVLIAPGLVLTALHCVGLNPDASDKALVFDYESFDALGDDAATYDDLTVFAAGSGDPYSEDWALLASESLLNADRDYVHMPQPADGIGSCEPVYTVGHPRGYPLRRSGGDDPSAPQAWSLGAPQEGIFQTTLDALDGFSGAPVLSLSDDRLVGLVVRGGLSNNSPIACSQANDDCLEEDDVGAAQLSLAIDLSTLEEAHVARDNWCAQLEDGC